MRRGGVSARGLAGSPAARGRHLSALLLLFASLVMGSAAARAPASAQTGGVTHPDYDDDWWQYCLYDQWPERIQSSWRVNDVTLDGYVTDAAEWSEAEEWFLPLQLWDGQQKHYAPCQAYMRAWFMNDGTHLYGLYRVPWPDTSSRPISGDDEGGIAMLRGGAMSDFSSIPSSTTGLVSGPWDAHNPDIDSVEGWFSDDETLTGTIDMEGAGALHMGYWFEWRKPLDSGDQHDWSLEPGQVVEDSTWFLANFWDRSEQHSYEHFFRLTLAGGPLADLPALESIVPARVLETRPGYSTVDGRYQGIGLRAARSVTKVQVAGRAGVPAGVDAVVLNVTAVRPSGHGHLRVYPCGPLPTASNVNYRAGDVAPNAVLSKVDANGYVCVYTVASTHLLIDVNGYVPDGGSPPAVAPARVLETRPGYSTVDGRNAGIGLRAARSVTRVRIAGRAGVPADVDAVFLNVTAVRPSGHGHLRVYPCGPLPLASNVNYRAGDVAPNAVMSKVDANGDVCVYTVAATHILIDVNGYVPEGGSPPGVEPARVLETRPGFWTFDGLFKELGLRPARSVTKVRVAGRAGVPADVDAVILNVTAVWPSGHGHLRVYPCGPLPTASTVNYRAGDVAPNAVLTKVDEDGDVCIYTVAPTHLVVDVGGYVSALE